MYTRAMKPASFFDSLKEAIEGDLELAPETLKHYSRDASIFEIVPRAIVFPKHSRDVQAIVRWVDERKAQYPELSITPRAAGTDMSGGAIGPSIILDTTRYMARIHEVTDTYATVEPGCMYRDFERATMKRKRIMPAYPASREICAVGGMVANNSGGEKSIKYGKAENYIKELKAVFADAHEYTIRPLTKTELEAKIAAGGFEGELYGHLWQLITEHHDEIMAAKPRVSKNSAGYYLWNVYDPKTGIFDLCRLVVGSQGTLCIITEITFRLVPVEPHSGMLVAFLPDLTQLGNFIAEILPFGPDSLESYDDYSMKLALRFFFDFFKQLGVWQALKLGIQFIPDLASIMRGGSIPKLIVMAEFTGSSRKEIAQKLSALEKKIRHFHYRTHIARTKAESEKYWRVRRESFNLLRKHAHGKRTAPFIDDFIVEPKHLPKFLPQVQKLINEYKLDYTVAGHPGNGNFHIIPLVDLAAPYSAEMILELSGKVYDLVQRYGGSITAEHNDGIIRTPYLPQMFGEKIVGLFQETKQIFDEQGIFNPHKKTGGTFDEIKKYIAKKEA